MVGIRILFEELAGVVLEDEGKLTMATFRPNWFLISPSLNASGHSSRMMEKRFLIPMIAIFWVVLVVGLVVREGEVVELQVVGKMSSLE